MTFYFRQTKRAQIFQTDKSISYSSSLYERFPALIIDDKKRKKSANATVAATMTSELMNQLFQHAGPQSATAKQIFSRNRKR